MLKLGYGVAEDLKENPRIPKEVNLRIPGLKSIDLLATLVGALSDGFATLGGGRLMVSRPLSVGEPDDGFATVWGDISTEVNGGSLRVGKTAPMANAAVVFSLSSLPW